MIQCLPNLTLPIFFRGHPGLLRVRYSNSEKKSTFQRLRVGTTCSKFPFLSLCFVPICHHRHQRLLQQPLSPTWQYGQVKAKKQQCLSSHRLWMTRYKDRSKESDGNPLPSILKRHLKDSIVSLNILKYLRGVSQLVKRRAKNFAEEN